MNEGEKLLDDSYSLHGMVIGISLNRFLTVGCLLRDGMALLRPRIFSFYLAMERERI